jgi:large conductance mechanosensitive channel
MPLQLAQEFKAFILKGNVVDLAVGLTVGAAFSTVVKSLVDHLIMPPVGFVLAGVDFSKWKYVLAEEIKEGQVHPVYRNIVEQDIPAVTINYGLFLGNLLHLVIVGAAIFAVIKALNALRLKEELSPPPPPGPKPAPPPPADIKLLTEIRDLLKDR